MAVYKRTYRRYEGTLTPEWSRFGRGTVIPILLLVALLVILGQVHVDLAAGFTAPRLAADGKLAEGARWVQESVIGSTFGARYRWLDRERGHVAPTIVGRAYVNAEATLLLDDADPYCWGIR